VPSSHFFSIQYFQQLNRTAGTAKYLKIRGRRRVLRVLRKRAKSRQDRRVGKVALQIFEKIGVQRSQSLSMTTGLVHRRPAAPLVLLAGAAGTHFIPTDFGGSASWFAPLATEPNLPSLRKILVSAQEPNRQVRDDFIAVLRCNRLGAHLRGWRKVCWDRARRRSRVAGEDAGR